jgi:glycosyltransferase involved in cell wall biosynthesis
MSGRHDNMSPLISVIIPTYNREKLVGEAIASILTQRLQDFEILVIDDGSTDSTLKVLSQLRYPIKVLKSNRNGPAKARNIGIQEARGDYIAFLDSDDLWEPNKLQRQLTYLRRFKHIPFVYTNVRFREKNQIKRKTLFDDVVPLRKHLLPALVSGDAICTSTVMIKKQIFDEVGLFDERLKIHEDQDLWNRISSRYTLGHINEPLCIMRLDTAENRLLASDNIAHYISESKKYLDIYRTRQRTMPPSMQVARAIQNSYKVLELLERKK